MDCVAEGLRETGVGAAAALLGRCDQYGDGEVEYHTNQVVPARLSGRKLLCDFQKALLLFCLCVHTAQAPTDGMVQCCVFAKGSLPASSLPNQKPRQPPGSLPQIQG